MRTLVGRGTSIAAALTLLAASGIPAAATMERTGPRGVTSAADASTIEREIDAALSDAKLDGALAGVVVREAATGAVVYTRNGANYFAPASNEKLLVSAAALELLGPEHRFTTNVVATGKRVGATQRGDIFLTGSGDPTLSPAAIDELAAKVAATGVTTFTGSLFADDSAFDTVRLGTDWAWDDEPYLYAAQISALTVAGTPEYDTAVVRVRWAAAATAGEPPVVTLDPPTSYVTVQNNAVTGPAGTPRQIAVTRRHGTNTIVVTGTIPVGGAPGTNLRTIEDPTLYAAHVFRAALAAHGVTVTNPKTLRRAAPHVAPVATRESPTLAQILPWFLKLSNNGHAELLVKAIGRKVAGEGSWPAGLGAIAAYLRTAGVDTAKLRMIDGSGLSRLDLLTAEQLTAFLAAVQTKPWFAAWYDALPIAGNTNPMIGGTLANRMGGTAAANNVHAKTGSMTSVSALSGYVTTADGQKLIFSVLLNNVMGSTPVTTVENRIAVALANVGAPAATATQQLARVAKEPARIDDPTTTVDERSLECSWVKAC